MGPLSGIKIVELAGIGPGPYAGMLLADLGADVILTPGDRDLPGLQRLAQGLHHIGREQRELIEEQHPQVGLAHLSWSHPAGAAAEDAAA